MKAYTIEKDGTAKGNEGRTIFFSFQRFKDEICKKGHCFVCGASPNKSFNNEHIFPDWILRHCSIHGEKLTLPNGNLVGYSTYKIPCCKACNSLLADIYEVPISKAVCGGYDSLLGYVENGGFGRLCAWLALIFVKVHLRDFRNKVSLDNRDNKGMIGDEYELHELHHLHALARATTANVEVDEKVFGTLVILQVGSSSMGSAFDYADDLRGRGLLLQVQDIALIHVLDDCGATAGMLSEQRKTWPCEISKIQLREIYARHLAANIHIKETPTFRTEFVGPKGRPRIAVKLPKLDIHDNEPSVFGSIFSNVLRNSVKNITLDGKTGDAALEAIAAGNVSFLIDENGGVKNPSEASETSIK